MTYPLPAEYAPPHMTAEDIEEIDRLLGLVFEREPDPVVAAQHWLKNPNNGVFNCSPLEMLQRDELGVVRVISYLKHHPDI
jgi:hypothetical protein